MGQTNKPTSGTLNQWLECSQNYQKHCIPYKSFPGRHHSVEVYSYWDCTCPYRTCDLLWKLASTLCNACGSSATTLTWWQLQGSEAVKHWNQACKTVLMPKNWHTVTGFAAVWIIFITTAPNTLVVAWNSIAIPIKERMQKSNSKLFSQYCRYAKDGWVEDCFKRHAVR